MARTRKNTKDHTRKALVIAGITALMLMTAGASAYITTQSIKEDDKPVVQKTQQKRDAIAWDQPRQVQTQPVQQRVACNDGNIVGKIAGGVGGGALASNVGKGRGKTAAVIGGTLGGAYLGGEYIPTHNVTCR